MMLKSSGQGFLHDASQRSAAPVLCGAGCAVVPPCAPRVEGRQSADRRWCGTPHPVTRLAVRADPWSARDHRPMTPAGAPLGAPPRHFWRSRLRRSSGSRFREPAFAPTRPAGSLQSGPSAARHSSLHCVNCVHLFALPGAARVRGYESRPQGPPPAPSAERLRKTPSASKVTMIVLMFLYKLI